MFPPTLKTERLVLRPLEVSDSPILFERCSSDPRVTRYMSWETNASVEDTSDFIQHVIDPKTAGKPPWGTVWAICIEGDACPSGTIGVLPRGRRVELGYALAHDAWGRGLMTEATSALCAALWADPQLWRIQAHTHPKNYGSARVLEKCGFLCEGVARRMHVLPQLGDEPRDHRVYAKVRDDLA